ncbi:HAD-like domain-containing protein [Dipodascopsis uninucleata]
MSETEINLPWTLRYPIRIVQIHSSLGAEVKKNSPLFTYSYRTNVTETRDLGEEVTVERELFATFEAPVEGTISKWFVSIGEEIEDSGKTVLSIAEACTHAVQFAGMCALCGKDLTFQDYSGYQESARANIKMFHNTTGLTVSLQEAERIEKNTVKQLLAAQKLILVVDLDQTVIHTTVDPTVGEWKQDPSNPNYGAVKDVHSFCLKDAANPAGFWYYVKLRPGLKEFLENISKLYELHIYTMATKSYALAISKIIDPDGKFFGDRILSRDESGNLEQKTLQRLFPVDTSLVVIIDDRGDVWKWSANLIKVLPYEFFVGIGDINSSFLPKRQDYGLSNSSDDFDDDDDDFVSHNRTRNNLLSDDDGELPILEKVLVKVHTEYYNEYNKNKPAGLNNKRKRTPIDWKVGVPDIKKIMPLMKAEVFKGVVLLFSGVIPLGTNFDNADIVLWSRSFGATVVNEFSTDVTHVIAERAGTKKVYQAKEHPHIKIVVPAWIYKCLSTWSLVPEDEYHLSKVEDSRSLE